MPTAAETTRRKARTIKLEDLHKNSKIMEVTIGDLKVDRSYQRDPSQQLVDKISEEWDIIASELILVSDRGKRTESGGLYLVNGQHRCLAGTKLGHQKIWARVVDLSGDPDPAATEAFFRLKTNVRMGDRPLERFRAQVRAGDTDSVKIVEILAKHDTGINYEGSVAGEAGEGIWAVATIEAIYNQDPTGALLSETLGLIHDIYGSFSGRRVGSANLRAIAWLVDGHYMNLSRDRLVARVKDMGIEALHRKAVALQGIMGGAMWMNYYRQMMETYNEGLVKKSIVELRMRGSGTFAKRSRASIGSTWAGKGAS